MPHEDEFRVVFARLRSILEPYASKLVVDKDTESEYILITRHMQKNKKPLYFGAVRMGKAYVSFHLVALYEFPELAEGLSTELTKRRQGKTCFNFKAVDERPFKELAALTKKGFARYEKASYV
jgi:hypothetical protein